MALDMEVMGEAVQTRSWSCWYSSASTGECETLSWSTATARFLETAKFRWAKNKYTLRVTNAKEFVGQYGNTKLPQRYWDGITVGMNGRLAYDIRIHYPNGDRALLSQINAKKSGGETTTPFYVAMAASFAQAYRLNQPRASDTIRLAMFDEAFSKMDTARTASSICGRSR